MKENCTILWLITKRTLLLPSPIWKQEHFQNSRVHSSFPQQVANIQILCLFLPLWDIYVYIFKYMYKYTYTFNFGILGIIILQTLWPCLLVHTCVSFCWIYIVRNRIARFYSQFMHFLSLIHSAKSFSTVVLIYTPITSCLHLVLLGSNFGHFNDVSLFESTHKLHFISSKGTKIYKYSHGAGWNILRN